MSTVWLIQHPTKSFQIHEALMGEFPLRAFASLASFRTLIRTIARNEFPALVVVDHMSLKEDLPMLQSALEAELPTIHKVIISQVSVATNQALFTIVKPPFDEDKLMLAIKALLKQQRTVCVSNKQLRYKDIQFSEQTMQLQVLPNEEACDLSLKEAKLLRLFLNNPHTCLSKNEILKQVWGETKVSPRTVDSQVSRLRRKISGSEAVIASIYGGGYKLD